MVSKQTTVHSEDLCSLLSHGSHRKVLPRKTAFPSGYVHRVQADQEVLSLFFIPPRENKWRREMKATATKNRLHNTL